MTRRRCAAMVGVVCLRVAACGSGSGGKADEHAAGPATTSGRSITGPTAGTSAGDEPAFCAALATVKTSTDSAKILAAYDTMEATAPPDIAGYVKPFVDAAREVSTAAKQLPAGATQDQFAAMVAGLSPQGQALVNALGSAAKSGTYPDGAVGTVLRYGVDHCHQ